VSRLILEKSPQTAAFAPYGMVGVAFFKIVPKVITLTSAFIRPRRASNLIILGSKLQLAG
jgi:hypothetical protein